MIGIENTAQPRCDAAARPAEATGTLTEKVPVLDLSFFYGANKALKNITVPLYDRKVTAFIGPSGCGKSTLLRVLNRMYELYPNQHAEGEVLLDGENILATRTSICCAPASAWCSRSRRPFPCRSMTMSLSAFGCMRSCRASEMDERVRDGAPPRRAVGRGQGQAATRRLPVGRPAAAAVHRPHDRGAGRK